MVTRIQGVVVAVFDGAVDDTGLFPLPLTVEEAAVVVAAAISLVHSSHRNGQINLIDALSERQRNK